MGPRCDFHVPQPGEDPELFKGFSGAICRICAAQAVAYFIRQDDLEDGHVTLPAAEEEAA